MMTTYESAPAARMLATFCAACGRPLCDAASVEAGMGPDCRDKYGVTSLDEASRKEANQLVYQIALDQTGPEVAAALAKLRQLGADALADRITKRLASEYAVVINDEGARFSLKAPYNPDLVNDLRRIEGRRWEAARKLTTFPNNAKAAVWAVIKRHYAGRRGLGPKGEFTI
jgi:hypothetical protein